MSSIPKPDRRLQLSAACPACRRQLEHETAEGWLYDLCQCGRVAPVPIRRPQPADALDPFDAARALGRQLAIA